MHQPPSTCESFEEFDLKLAIPVLLFVFLAIFATNTFAWGKVGHQVVATLAATQLTPNARTEVDRLLALEPGATLASISTWADEHRNPATGPWHYLNLPRGTCTFDANRDCPDGKCVVGAIERQLEVLSSKGDDETRLKALKYVVHFVADVHQPLHAGFGDDKGGNKYQVQFGGRGTNLHAVWDSGLIRSGEEGAEAMAQRFAAHQKPVSAGDLSMVQAAQESCKIVSGPDFYPGRHVGQDYVEHFAPVMEQRLVSAGGRLAGLLNVALK